MMSSMAAAAASMAISRCLPLVLSCYYCSCSWWWWSHWLAGWLLQEHVWSYLFNEKMHIDTKDHRVLLTEAPLNPRENRIKMAEVMFEKYGFQAMQVGIQATLTLFAQGLMSGLVLDSGDGVTHVVVVSDNYAIPHLTSRLNVAGRHITRHLIKLMMLRGYTFNRTSDFQTAQVRGCREQDQQQ